MFFWWVSLGFLSGLFKKNRVVFWVRFFTTTLDSDDSY